jgi:hypothetical protein
MWKKIGIKNDSSPQQGSSSFQTSPQSSSRDKYNRHRPLDEKSLLDRDMSNSRISENSGLVKIVPHSMNIDLIVFNDLRGHPTSFKQ